MGWQVDTSVTFGIDRAKEFGLVGTCRIGERQTVRPRGCIQSNGQSAGLVLYLVGGWSRCDGLGTCRRSVGKQLKVGTFVHLALLDQYSTGAYSRCGAPP